MGMLYHINENMNTIMENCKSCKNNSNFPDCFRNNQCINDIVVKAKDEFLNRYNKIKSS